MGFELRYINRPAVGAVIGYITNDIAILFRPHHAHTENMNITNKVITLLAFILFATAAHPQNPSAKIENTWIEANVKNDNIDGMNIHVSLSIHGMKGHKVNILAQFYDSNKKPFEAPNAGSNYLSADKHLWVWKEAMPNNDNTRYNDFSIFMPYDKFPTNLQGKELYYVVFVNGIEKGWLPGNSQYVPFQLSTPVKAEQKKSDYDVVQEFFSRIKNNSNLEGNVVPFETYKDSWGRIWATTDSIFNFNIDGKLYQGNLSLSCGIRSGEICDFNMHIKLDVKNSQLGRIMINRAKQRGSDYSQFFSLILIYVKAHVYFKDSKEYIISLSEDERINKHIDPGCQLRIYDIKNIELNFYSTNCVISSLKQVSESQSKKMMEDLLANKDIDRIELVFLDGAKETIYFSGPRTSSTVKAMLNDLKNSPQ